MRGTTNSSRHIQRNTLGEFNYNMPPNFYELPPEEEQIGMNPFRQIVGFGKDVLDSNFGKSVVNATGEVAMEAAQGWVQGRQAERDAKTRQAVAISEARKIEAQRALAETYAEAELIMLDKKQKNMLTIAAVLAGGLILYRMAK